MFKNDFGLWVEADIHCLATCGSKWQLMDKIAKHYASVSHVNRKKRTAKDVKTDLPKKRGRKPSKSDRRKDVKSIFYFNESSSLHLKWLFDPQEFQ